MGEHLGRVLQSQRISPLLLLNEQQAIARSASYINRPRFSLERRTLLGKLIVTFRDPCIKTIKNTKNPNYLLNLAAYFNDTYPLSTTLFSCEIRDLCILHNWRFKQAPNRTFADKVFIV